MATLPPPFMLSPSPLILFISATRPSPFISPFCSGLPIAVLLRDLFLLSQKSPSVGSRLPPPAFTGFSSLHPLIDSIHPSRSFSIPLLCLPSADPPFLPALIPRPQVQRQFPHKRNLGGQKVEGIREKVYSSAHLLYQCALFHGAYA